MGSSDTYHPKTVWMAQGATHLRCSSGAEIHVAAGGKFVNKRVAVSTGVKNTSTLDPNGWYAIGTSGVYEINPTRGSLCTIFVHTTANAFFKGSSELDAVRFPTSCHRVIKAKGTTKDNKMNGPGFQIYGFSTHRAYIGGIAGFSSDAHDTKLIIGFATST